MHQLLSLMTPKGAAPGQQAYTTPGTYSWLCPASVTSIGVVAVGGASRPGGGLGYINNYPTTPGNSYTVVVGAGATHTSLGGDSYFVSTAVCAGKGPANTTTGGLFTGDGGGNGGNSSGQGGGGAGGYSGNGGAANSSTGAGSAGAGGGGGGGGAVSSKGYSEGGFGGGVGILGQGSNGTAGSSAPGNGGAGSSGSGQNYGGGGRYNSSSWVAGADGAVRIIWGAGRSFPSTNTADV